MNERLTMTSDKGGLAFTFDLDVSCSRSEMLKIVALGEHLKAYEDLGTVEELAEMVKARQDGRCVVLPCEPFVAVYMIDSEQKSIYKFCFTSMGEVVDNTEKFGETWFLTREEAEEALKGAEHE